ncbi:DUF6266 family protein [Algoriphagus sp. CAU 1675]|uniref:DUF6266 family protein n=1 Tax=Algoriphagus sp. CAU 1675 TaxID=3032597 RepID=UPI0023DAB69C|nr:DUF6266 family protein [Algoriphagus sp. CAU 1675]MDF2156242.1 DUF6266 family protein [Algoriphagus sp. CAU 1675]
MARVTNSILEGMRGKIGDIVIYKIGGKTYSRRAPSKQSKNTKKKTSELKRLSQSVNTQTHAFLKNYTHLLRFGYQELADGGSRPYHAAVSHTSKNSFVFQNGKKVLDLSLVKLSKGSLTGAQNAKAERNPEGILFSWENNSWIASAKPSDQAFVILINQDGSSIWEFFGNYRELGSYLLPVSETALENSWFAFLAFSQENPWTKKRILSDSVYLGEI